MYGIGQAAQSVYTENRPPNQPPTSERVPKRLGAFDYCLAGNGKETRFGVVRSHTRVRARKTEKKEETTG